MKGKLNMYIEPNTTIKLLKDVPLDETYEHTLYFSSVSNQTNYFSSKAKYTIDKSTYQRVNKGSLKVGYPADRLYDCNYIMFLNTGFGSKWFYGFITAVEYINNDTTLITYVLDDMQTWMFDYQLKQCFVEREHTETDVIGEHTVPEGLELGGYITTNSKSIYTGLANRYDIVMLATEQMSTDTTHNPEHLSLNPPQRLYGYPINCYWRSWSPLSEAQIDDTLDEVKNYCDVYSSSGKADSIVSIYLTPSTLGASPSSYFIDDTTYASRVLPISVKNNKLYCYPYCCLGVVGTGQSAELKYELFSGSPTARLISSLYSPSPTLTLYPTNYEGIEEDISKSLNIKGYPLLCWKNNYYQNWLAQNQSSLTASYLTAGASVLGGIAMAVASGVTENPLGVVGGIATAVSGVGKVANTIAQTQDHSVLPDQLGGTIDNANNMFIAGKLYFRSYCRTIRPEYMRIIDNFFTRYGYKINRTKVPNTHSRPHWNYVKTIDCAVVGSVPADALKHICSIYDNGITFWKNPSEVGNYSLDNRP